MKITDEAVQAATGGYRGHATHDSAIRAALTAAAPYMQRVKVKALEWEGDCAVTPFGNYTHGEEDRGWRYIFHDYPFGMPCDEFYSSAEAAKAAAQADYEKRILSALEPSATREQALEEALRNLLHAVCGETGFANAVRQVSGLPWPWPSLDIAEAAAIRALKSQPAQTGGDRHGE